MRQSFIIIIAFIISMQSLCSCNYYALSKTTGQQAGMMVGKLDSLRSSGRYLILRNGLNDAFAIGDLAFGADRQTVRFTLGPVAAGHKYYLGAGASDRRYRRGNALQKPVVNEAHIYIPYDASVATGSYTLSLDKIERVEVLKHDAKRSTNSHVLSGLGMVAGGLGLALVIVLATIPYD